MDFTNAIPSNNIKPAGGGAAFGGLARAGILRHTNAYRRSARRIAHGRPNPIWELGDLHAAYALLATMTVTN